MPHASQHHAEHDDLRSASQGLQKQLSDLLKNLDAAVCILFQEERHYALVSQSFKKHLLAAMDRVDFVEERLKHDDPLVDDVSVWHFVVRLEHREAIARHIVLHAVSI